MIAESATSVSSKVTDVGVRSHNDGRGTKALARVFENKKNASEISRGGVFRLSRFKSDCSVPVQRSSALVFGDAGFEEVLFFRQVNCFAHPRERIW